MSLLAPPQGRGGGKRQCCHVVGHWQGQLSYFEWGAESGRLRRLRPRAQWGAPGCHAPLTLNRDVCDVGLHHRPGPPSTCARRPSPRAYRPPPRSTDDLAPREALAPFAATLLVSLLLEGLLRFLLR